MAAARIAIVTGATGAIGREIARGVAAAGFKTILTCRDATRGAKLAKEVATESGNAAVESAVVDLASIGSVAHFAHRFNTEHGKLHLLVNNAATVTDKKALSPDGLELQLAVNVVAYFVLIHELAPSLRAVGDGARVVNVASNYAGQLDLADLNFERRRYDSTSAYQQSKQADRMLTAAASKWLHGTGVTVNACHPGVVTSPLLKGLGMSRGHDSAEDGAATPLFLALDDTVGMASGQYFVASKHKACPYMADAEGCDALWAWCEKQLQAHKGVEPAHTGRRKSLEGAAGGAGGGHHK